MGWAAWAKLIITLAQGLATFVVWAHENEAIRKALAAHDALWLEKAASAIKQATTARDAQRRANDAVPPSDSLPDDGFRRD